MAWRGKTICPTWHAVVRDLPVDRLHYGMRLGADGDRTPEVGVGQRLERGEGQPASRFPQSHQRGARWRRISNSVSRLRSGFSPSLERKSVQRERMFPAMCFTMTAIEFDFGIQHGEEALVGALLHGALG